MGVCEGGRSSAQPSFQCGLGRGRREERIPLMRKRENTVVPEDRERGGVPLKSVANGKWWLGLLSLSLSPLYSPPLVGEDMVADFFRIGGIWRWKVAPSYLPKGGGSKKRKKSAFCVLFMLGLRAAAARVVMEKRNVDGSRAKCAFLVDGSKLSVPFCNTFQGECNWFSRMRSSWDYSYFCSLRLPLFIRFVTWGTGSLAVGASVYCLPSPPSFPYSAIWPDKRSLGARTKINSKLLCDVLHMCHTTIFCRSPIQQVVG